MRTNINIVWVEDDLTISIEDCQRHLTDEFIRRGYKPNIRQFDSLAGVIQYITDPQNRVDLFITDYNMSDGELPPEHPNVKNGLDFIEFLRQDWKNLVVLYTNAGESVVKADYKTMLDSRQLGLLTNVFFIPLDQDISIVENSFREAIAYFTCNWDELNAMRARFMAEHAEIEAKLLTLMNKSPQYNITYASLINEYERKIKLNGTLTEDEKNLFSEWRKSKNRRNALAHVAEEYDKVNRCYCIISNSDSTIKLTENEDDIIRERLALSALKDKIYELMQSHPVSR